MISSVVSMTIEFQFLCGLVVFVTSFASFSSLISNSNRLVPVSSEIFSAHVIINVNIDAFFLAESCSAIRLAPSVSCARQ